MTAKFSDPPGGRDGADPFVLISHSLPPLSSPKFNAPIESKKMIYSDFDG